MTSASQGPVLASTPRPSETTVVHQQPHGLCILCRQPVAAADAVGIVDNVLMAHEGCGVGGVHRASAPRRPIK